MRATFHFLLFSTCVPLVVWKLLVRCKFTTFSSYYACSWICAPVLCQSTHVNNVNVNKSPVADLDMVVKTTVTSRSNSPIRSTHTITVFPFPVASSSITLYTIWAKPILTTGLQRRNSQGGEGSHKVEKKVQQVCGIHTCTHTHLCTYLSFIYIHKYVGNVEFQPHN